HPIPRHTSHTHFPYTTLFRSLPAGLLEKAGALTLEERRQMEAHAAIGERILSNVEDYKEIAKVVRHHHERVDGNGYPDGLTDDEDRKSTRLNSSHQIISYAVF